MMENISKLVVVVSRNYSTGLGIIRSLGAKGYTVDLIASTKKKGSSRIIANSRYVRNSFEVVSDMIQGDSGEGIVKQLMSYSNYDEKPVLLTVDDFTTTVIDNNREILKDIFIMPELRCSDGSSIANMMVKTNQTKLASMSGFDTPLEWIVSIKDKISLPNDIVYPCFVKPLSSVDGKKSEITVCYDSCELENHLIKMKSFYSNRDVLVQEFLLIDREYDLSGVCLNDEIILPAIIEKTRISRYERGVTMTGKLIDINSIPGLKEKIHVMFKKLNYIGMFDLELSLCGSKLYFNEINFRSGGPNYMYFLSGANLPAILVEWLTKKTYNIQDGIVSSLEKTFVYEKVAWEDYIHFFMTRKELSMCLKDSDFKLLNDRNDRKPGRIFSSMIILSFFKNRLRYMVKK